MTTYGWDASHYDGVLTLADLQRALKEGIEFFTHKLGEGLGGEDVTQGTALAAARDAGMTVIGGYWFCHGEDDPVAEADKCKAMADKDEPWWSSFPGWFWQVDAETETGHTKPSRAWIDAFAARLVATTQRTVITYASAGQYGNTLAGLSTDLWNAHYGTNPTGTPAACYAAQGGDKSAGWNTYSGQIPVLLQFGSGVTIAGKTTCDGNAFRGTIAELLTLIGGNVTVADDVWGWDNLDGITSPPRAAGNAAWTPKSALQQVTNDGYVTRGTVSAMKPVADSTLSQSRSNGGGISALSTKVDALTNTVNQILAMLQAGGAGGPVSEDLTVTGTVHVSTPTTQTPPQASTNPSP